MCLKDLLNKCCFSISLFVHIYVVTFSLFGLPVCGFHTVNQSGLLHPSTKARHLLRAS